MDSITQVILGAACGEAVGGRKLGNRAMLWGGVGGTIPDLDVLSGLFTNEMTSLAFHRGFMHSFLFAFLFPWLIGWVVHKLYASGVYRKRSYKLGWFVVSAIFAVGIAVLANAIPIILGKSFNPVVCVISVALAGIAIYRLWVSYLHREHTIVEYSYLGWVHLFFWSIVTHPILDAFTGYGTQLFQPFSDYRVQWDTVSIVDPLYTVPFALSLWIASRMQRTSHRRVIVNWAGILLSCAYLGYTVYHKMIVQDVFRSSLAAQQIPYNRFTTGPTIFNNILWKGTVESDSCYYFGMWGFNDPTQFVPKFTKLPKNHHLAADSLVVSRDLRILKWFSDGYYNVIQDPKTQSLYLNDLRFGLTSEEDKGLESYIFTWKLEPDPAHGGKLSAHQYNEPRGDVSTMFGQLMRRMSGEVQK